MIASLRRISAVAALLVAIVPFFVHAATVEYAYDENGRLVGAIAPSGDSAQYVYDPAGNIVQINRIGAGTFALIDFAPKSGPVGATVTIWGSGFSATPSQNAVTFNGTSASVVAATANKLTVTVPSGATTGAIAVTVGTSFASSAKPFTVTGAIACSGRFSGFTPTIAVPGTAVTISGSGLNTGTTSAMVNGFFASAVSATSTSFAINVPSSATSGALSASVPPECGAQPLGDFFVPPAGFSAADIGATGRLTINGPPVTATLAAGKKALYVFDASFNTGTTLFLSGSTLGSVTADIRARDGSVLKTVTFTAASASVGPLYLTTYGGFSVFVNPSAAGSITMQLAAPDLTISSASVAAITENQNGTFNIPVTFTVTNIGAVTAQPGWYDYAYLGVRFDVTTRSLNGLPHSTALGVNQSYTVNQTYTASNYSPGPYTLFLRTDDGTGSAARDAIGSVTESNENNNLSAINVVLPPYPDLALSNASVGAIAESQNGSFSIPVSFTVTNLSTTPAQPTWLDYAYLSSNGVLDSATPNAGYVGHGTVLAGGASYVVNQILTTSAFSPGAYTLFLKTDGAANGATNGSVAESAENNNTSAGIPITLPSYPDLALTNPSVGTITENQNGSFDIPVSFTVTNLGSTTAQPSWNDFVHLSRNGLFDSSSTVLGWVPRSAPLAGGASYTVNQTFRTSGITPGSYTLFFKADGPSSTSNGYVKESDETNNTSVGMPITLPTYPDLAISNPSVGAITKNANGTYNIPVTFTITNIGQTTAQPSWNDYGFLSRNGLLDSSSTIIGYMPRSTALAPSASYTVSQTYNVSGFTAGTYTLFLKADGSGNGSLVEADETNNATSGISVTLP